MSLTSNLPRSAENMTDSQLEMYRRLLDAKIARIARERETLSFQETTARNDLNEVEQEQQNRLADHALMERVEEHRAWQEYVRTVMRAER
jgi:hypothetical protein